MLAVICLTFPCERGTPMNAMLITLVVVFGVGLLGCLLTPWFLTLTFLSVLTALIFVRARRVPLKYAILLTYVDDLVYALMNFPGRHFDQNGISTLGSGPRTHRYGRCCWITNWRSWVFYLGWFVKPVRYDEYNDPDGFGSDIYVDMSDHFMSVRVENAETKDVPDPDDPQKTMAGPVASFDAQFPGSVVDPKQFVVNSPPNVLQKGIVDEFEAMMKSWARRETEPSLLDAQVGGEIGRELLDSTGVDAQPVFDVMQNRWGFNLPPKSITIKKVVFSKRHEDARQAVREASLLAHAKKKTIFDPVMAVLPAGATLTADQAVRLRALDMGATVQDFNIHSAGQPVNPGTLVVGGNSGFGVMDRGGRKGGDRSGDKGANPSGGQQGGGQTAMTAEDAQRYFDRYGKYPKRDPLKRMPQDI